MPNVSQKSIFSLDVLSVKDTTSTFTNNMSLPIHRWYRFSAGFSADWVKKVIDEYSKGEKINILDPFVGSGTVLVQSELEGMNSIGIEAHPFIFKLAKSKLLWKEDVNDFLKYANEILEDAQKIKSNIESYSPLIKKCYSENNLHELDSIYRAWKNKADSSKNSELTWFVLASILRETSSVGTAQWQYLLPKKIKVRLTTPYVAFQKRIGMMRDDMLISQKESKGLDINTDIYWEDARTCDSILDSWADLIITSPPYANNYDYADAMRLEMSFFGDIKGWGDLQNTVRKYLVRSCTQHSASLKKDVWDIIEDPVLRSIKTDLLEVCKTLDLEKEKHGGKKPYHTMIAAYFNDMAKVWIALRRVTKKGGKICFVIGDSAPYGVYVPVDKWLGELALSAGFKSYSFEKTRDRNVKWKNRKHRVLLKEGRLWVQA